MAIVTCPQCGAKNRVDERALDRQPVCGRCGTKLKMEGQSGAVGHPINVTDSSFAADVLEVRGKPVLLDCWAEWCQPCRMIAPAINQLAAESNGQWVIAKLNVDQNQRTASQFQIDSIPALLIFKDGRLADRVVGLQPVDALRRRLMAQMQ